MSLYFPVASAAAIVRAGFIDGPVDGLHSTACTLAQRFIGSEHQFMCVHLYQLHYTYPPMRAFIIIAAAIAMATSSLLCARSTKQFSSNFGTRSIISTYGGGARPVHLPRSGRWRRR